MSEHAPETEQGTRANGTAARAKRAYCDETCRRLNRRRARSDDGFGLAKWVRESPRADVRALRRESVALKLGDVRFGRVLEARRGTCLGCAARIKPIWPDLSRTAAALAAFDRSEPDRADAWDRAQTKDDVLACVAADAAALLAVREAFALDTADRNSRENALLASPTWLRECVAKWRAQEVTNAAR